MRAADAWSCEGAQAVLEHDAASGKVLMVNILQRFGSVERLGGMQLERL
jgi:hypothetical protein